METKTLTYGAYRLVLDPSQVIPSDPGAGTPAMVYGPHGGSATYWCAVGEWELITNEGVTYNIPAPVVNWLVKQEDVVSEFLEQAEAAHG